MIGRRRFLSLLGGSALAIAEPTKTYAFFGNILRPRMVPLSYPALSVPKEGQWLIMASYAPVDRVELRLNGEPVTHMESPKSDQIGINLITAALNLKKTDKLTLYVNEAKKDVGGSIAAVRAHLDPEQVEVGDVIRVDAFTSFMIDGKKHKANIYEEVRKGPDGGGTLDIHEELRRELDV